MRLVVGVIDWMCVYCTRILCKKDSSTQTKYLKDKNVCVFRGVARAQGATDGSSHWAVTHVFWQYWQRHLPAWPPRPRSS